MVRLSNVKERPAISPYRRQSSLLLLISGGYLLKSWPFQRLTNLESSPSRSSRNQEAMLFLLTSMDHPETFTFTFVISKLAKSSARVCQSRFVRLEAFLLGLHC